MTGKFSTFITSSKIVTYIFVFSIISGGWICQPAGQADAPLPGAQTAETTLAVQYVANEGFLLKSDDAGVLIDGLFRAGIDPYAKVPPKVLTAAETGVAPYDVDAVLVSHTHADHFDPASVARHLRRNPKARLLSSQQVVDLVLALEAGAADRVQAVTPREGRREAVQAGAAQIDVLRIRHGHKRNYELHNLGHIIELGGKKVLHIGDAEMNAAHFTPFNLPAAEIDVALIPFWFLVDEAGRAIVDQHIQPKNLIAVHLPHTEAGRWAPEIKAHYPEAKIAYQSGMAWTF